MCGTGSWPSSWTGPASRCAISDPCRIFLGSLPHISVAGACATGTHGSGDANQSLAGSVIALEMVTADGELARLKRGSAEFAGAVAALVPTAP